MKNMLKIILSLSFLLVLSSCKSESYYDINELITELNEKYEYDFQYEDFTITRINNYICFVYEIDRTLLTIYCNKNCEIEQCTITSEQNSEFTGKLSQDVIDILTGNSNDLNINDSKNSGWKIKKIENNVGVTVIINSTTNSIHYNNNPKLK